MTKAEEVHRKTEALIAAGKTKAEAFKELAEEYGQPIDSIRGSFYAHARAGRGSAPSRTKRRETTAEDAVADARAALERAIVAIDREVTEAEARAKEAKAEADALKRSSAERKAAIAARLETLS